MPLDRVRKPAQSASLAKRPGVARAQRLSLPASAALEGLQRLAGNRATSGQVQRLIDGFDGKSKVPISKVSLTDAFKQKHVAEDPKGAIAKTGARIDAGKPPAMVAGTLGNTVATEANWKAAIDASTAVIPDQKDWSGGMAVKLSGWDAKRVPGQRKINITDLSDAGRTVGGYMKQKGGAVQIDHVSGQV
ncbi:MAG TPA: hypothetical protein PKD75_11990 [Tepidiformaceae bacterium]|jgi:hypothetical protein|nr:hypothetical protein [Tepidiformaceae bacterium]